MTKPDFDTIYANVPIERVEWLRHFRATHPYTHRSIDGVDWQYIACGQGEQTLLLLSGALSVGESAFERITELEGTYRIISPSYPPVGKIVPVVDGLAAILEAEGVSRAHVFGHSLGAAVAHAFIRRHPLKVDKLVLSSFGLYTRRNVRMANLYVWLFSLMPEGFMRSVYLPKIKIMLEGVDADEQAFMQAYFEELFAVLHTKKTMMGQFRLIPDMARYAEELGLFTPVERPGKVLILQAGDDRGFTQDEQAALRNTYPGAQVKLFESGGHWAGITRREEYNAALLGFLSG